ncbi:unnamed protein product [Symbiodinium sp. KB8]|nr:unnamed protein product [Symbiodinium sp. KB8]
MTRAPGQLFGMWGMAYTHICVLKHVALRYPEQMKVLICSTEADQGKPPLRQLLQSLPNPRQPGFPQSAKIPEHFAVASMLSPDSTGRVPFADIAFDVTTGPDTHSRFLAHRVVVGAQSPVLLKELETLPLVELPQEGITAAVFRVDRRISKDVWRAVLQFFYTGMVHCPFVKDPAKLVELFRAAAIYKLPKALLDLAQAARATDFGDARLVATDLQFMQGSPAEADDSRALTPYEQQVRRNIKYLKQRGVTVQEGWNLFEAYETWKARFGLLPHPGVILLVGLWNHNVDEQGAISEGKLSGRQFLGLAMEALKAQFPDATILAVNSIRHLNVTMGPMGYVGYSLKQGHGIDMLRYPHAVPSREPLGLGVVASGQTPGLHDFLAPGLPESGAQYDFDIMAYLQAALSAGQRILQLGGNRFQFFVAFLKYLDEHSWKPGSHPSSLGETASATPLPTRVSCVPFHQAGALAQADCQEEMVPSPPFTFPELVEATGSASADTVLTWLDAIPSGLLQHNHQNVSCEALRNELRRTRQDVSLDDARGLGPWSFPVRQWCTVYMGASYGSDPSYRASAEHFGRLLAQNGIGLLYGGGNAGLMGAVADAVLRESGYVIGVRPEGNLLTAEHEHKNLSHMIFTKSMHERKQTMVDFADLLVALPGGLGTLDELADAVVLAHLGTHSKPLYLLNTTFWTPLLKFIENMETAQFLGAGRFGKLVKVVDSAEDIFPTQERIESEAEAQEAEAGPCSFLQLEVVKIRSDGCPFQVGFLPALAAGCLCAVLIASFGVHSTSVSSGRCIVDLFMLITVLAATSRMISVPDSHALAIALGQNVSWSGLYLGISKWGDMIGNLLCAFPLNYWPDFWRSSSREAMICGMTVMSAGSALCLVTLSRVSEDSGVRDSATLPILLCVSRAIIGVGNGIVTQLVIVLLSKLTPPDDLPQEFQRAIFYVTVGTGLGPLASAAGYSLDVCSTTAPQFKTVGIIQLILLSSGLCAVMLFYPSEIGSKDVHVAEVSEHEDAAPNRIPIIAGLVLCALRSFVAGSVEVGTPLLLEDRFGWSIATTGLITGAAFLVGIPIRLAQMSAGRQLSEVAWIRLLTVAATLGTLLLLRAASKLLPGGYSLVLGDMIIFPSIYLSEGLAQGFMMRFVPHGGSNLFFEASSIALIMDMLINAFLGLGAVGARSIIEAGGERGQDFNAGMQLLCCVIFLIIFELGMARYVHDSKSE